MVFGLGRKKKAKVTGTQVHDVKQAVTGSLFAVNMMALIDGKISPEERESLIRYANSFLGGRATPEEVLNHIEQMHGVLTSLDPRHWGTVFDEMKPFHKTDRSFIMHAAASMAIADQELHEDEEQLMIGISHWIGMSKSEFLQWCTEFQDRLNEAKTNGYTIKTSPTGIFVS